MRKTPRSCLFFRVGPRLPAQKRSSTGTKSPFTRRCLISNSNDRASRIGHNERLNRRHEIDIDAECFEPDKPALAVRDRTINEKAVLKAKIRELVCRSARAPPVLANTQSMTCNPTFAADLMVSDNSNSASPAPPTGPFWWVPVQDYLG